MKKIMKLKLRYEFNLRSIVEVQSIFIGLLTQYLFHE